jgi:hypothetical protein
MGTKQVKLLITDYANLHEAETYLQCSVEPWPPPKKKAVIKVIPLVKDEDDEIL